MTSEPKRPLFDRLWPQGMRRRWWMFRPLDLAVRHWPVFKKPKGLLVVRMDGIGDMVLFRKTLDHYAEAFKIADGDITVLGCASWGSITPEVFSGFRLRIIDEHSFERKPFYRFKEALWVRRQAFAVAVSDIYFRKALTADSLVWFSGAPQKVMSQPYISEATKGEFGYYMGEGVQVVDTGPYPTHEIIRHFRFVSAVAGRPIAPEPPRISWKGQSPPVFDGPPYVVLNFGSNEPGRRWPFDNYLKIAERLLDLGLRVAFTGGSAAEKSRQPEMRRILNRPGVIDLIGRTKLATLLDLMKRAQAVLSNDTGPAHLAIALGTPTVVVVGGGHFGSFVPYPAEASPANARFVFHEMACYHCFWRCDKRATKEDVFPCIAAVSEEEIWSELSALLHIPEASQAAE
ncbi:MAG: glycosyltransferase family 9 protein [Rhodospirillales bacterium]|nr:MAG: glycosyltransferase family 9 protein [Rhodospirillales bacterium]